MEPVIQQNQLHNSLKSLVLQAVSLKDFLTGRLGILVICVNFVMESHTLTVQGTQVNPSMEQQEH